MESLSYETVRLKLESVLKPWRKQKWFIPKVGGCQTAGEVLLNGMGVLLVRLYRVVQGPRFLSSPSWTCLMKLATLASLSGDRSALAL